MGDDGSERVVDEVCHGETFNITCKPGERIEITDAKYGHMLDGRCSGKVECLKDATPHVKGICSGFQNCQFPVPDHRLPVIEECKITPYLIGAKYKCVRGQLLFLPISFLHDIAQNRQYETPLGRQLAFDKKFAFALFRSFASVKRQRQALSRSRSFKLFWVENCK